MSKIFRKYNWIKAAFILMAVLLFIPTIESQRIKPKQLREDILEQQSKEKSPEVKKQKKKRIEPPKTGTSTLKPANPTANKNATIVNLEKSDVLFYDQAKNANMQILKGNVRFKHDNALLYCDSAHFNDLANSFDAFGNVKIVQGDTLTIYGDFLNYDGNTKLAIVWRNVKLINRKTTLTTEMLYYDRAIDLSYYNSGGVVKDGQNTLISMWGQYSPSTKMALFKDNVKMINPDATLTTDTLKYNTSNSIADIVGNSLIVYKNETDIYSQRGWFDTKQDRMMLLDRSLVEQNDGKTLIGDTIFYDKEKKYGEAFSNVELNDPEQKTTLFGHFVSYDEIKEIGLATDSALFVDWSSRDSLFLSADTLYTFKDSLPDDSIAQNNLKGFKNVRFFRKDFQGMSDSITYSTRDSVLYLLGLPVVWSEKNQLMGQKISAFTKNQQIERVRIEQSAIAIQKDTLLYFNQLSGKEIIAHLDSGKLQRVYVNGNAETIYFPKDDKTGDFIGVNKTISSYVTMYLKDEQVDRIVLTTASSGTMYPLEDMEENDLYLRNFYWYENERPKSKEDLFTKFDRTPPPKRKESTKKPNFPGSKNDEGDSESTTQRDTNQNNPSTNNFDTSGGNRNLDTSNPTNRSQQRGGINLKQIQK